MIEIRWHARAGQGAKTASQLLAAAALREGDDVQAFPEYGPERSGAPMRAFTRIAETRIRRRYGIVHPDVVAVLDDSLLAEVDVAQGLRPGGLLIVNTTTEIPHAVCIDASGVAADPRYVNAVMAGAVAAALGRPSLDSLLAVAGKVAPDDVAAGFRAMEETRCAA